MSWHFYSLFIARFVYQFEIRMSRYIARRLAMRLSVFWLAIALLHSLRGSLGTLSTFLVRGLVSVPVSLSWWCRCVCVCACVCLCLCLASVSASLSVYANRLRETNNRGLTREITVT
jgi:hypothetical protein